MDSNYLVGVALAVSSGVFNQFGQLLQKKAVNEVPRDARDQRFMRTLLKNPVWLIGFVMAIGAGSAAFMIATDKIGPALVPGLMASGLIVLAIGSVKMNHERLDVFESLGIALMIIGILLLGLSELGISAESARDALGVSATVRRVAVFTVILCALWVITHLLALRSARRRGIMLAVSNGFPFCLSNFWISPLVAVIFIVLRGRGTSTQLVLFVIASIILVVTNVLGTWQTQMAFKSAQASNVIPVQQVPVQITPILVYFYVFCLTPPKSISSMYIVTGVFLIIVSGFLLGRRQTEPEASS